MRKLYQRRDVIKYGLGSLAGLSLLGLSACDVPNTSASTPVQNPTSGNLSMTYWGSATRDKLTKQTLALFHQANPNFNISSSLSDFLPYWPKLDGLIAAGKTPDLIQMDMRYVAQYVRKKQLLDLTELIYNQTIDLSDYNPLLLDSSKVNNTIYGVPMGGNYQCFIYDSTQVEKAGMNPPPDNMTWDEFADYAIALTNNLGGKVYGSTDSSSDITTFELWVRQHGRELYDRNGHLAFTLQDAVDWYTFWDKLRAKGGCAPYSVQKGLDVTGSPTTSAIIQGKTVILSTLSNLLEAYQKATTHQLALAIPPVGTSPGMFLKASMLISIAANTQYPQQAASYISFINNDFNAIKTLGVERGIPGSAAAQIALKPYLSPSQAATVDYINKVNKSNNTNLKVILDPPGASKVQDLLRSFSDNISAGKLSATQGAQQFFEQAKKAVQ